MSDRYPYNYRIAWYLQRNAIARGGEKPGFLRKSRRRCLSYLRNPVSGDRVGVRNRVSEENLGWETKDI